MARRFTIAQERTNYDRVRRSRRSHHLARVRRISVGDTFIATTQRTGVHRPPRTVVPPGPPPPPPDHRRFRRNTVAVPITLVPAMPKGDKLEGIRRGHRARRRADRDRGHGAHRRRPGRARATVASDRCSAWPRGTPSSRAPQLPGSMHPTGRMDRSAVRRATLRRAWEEERAPLGTCWRRGRAPASAVVIVGPEGGMTPTKPMASEAGWCVAVRSAATPPPC